MNNYFLESSGKSLRGTITCGSLAGCEGDETTSLDGLLDHLDVINSEFEAPLNPIPCIVSSGTLLGR